MPSVFDDPRFINLVLFSIGISILVTVLQGFLSIYRIIKEIQLSEELKKIEYIYFMRKR